jgi:hypothetical protein
MVQIPLLERPPQTTFPVATIGVPTSFYFNLTSVRHTRIIHLLPALEAGVVLII